MVYAANTWEYPLDSFPVIDYSSQSIGERKGKHTKTINKMVFVYSYNQMKKIHKNYSIDFDIMLEIKDKENSAFLALEIIKSLNNSNKKTFKTNINGLKGKRIINSILIFSIKFKLYLSYIGKFNIIKY